MMVPFIIAATSGQESTKGLVIALHSVLAHFGVPFAPLPIMGIIVGGLALKAIVGVLVTTYVLKIVGKVTRDMRIRLIRSLLGARWSYFVRQSVGRLAFAIGPESDAAGQSFEVLTGLLASVLQVLVFVAVLGLLSWQLLLIAIAVTLLTVLWFGGLVRQSRMQAKEHRQEVRQRASKFTDTLTGISNRGHFNAVAAGIVREAIVSGEKCSLLFIDIDNFKFVNDKHGHEIGDELLKTLATRIAENVEAITERRCEWGDDRRRQQAHKPGDPDG